MFDEKDGELRYQFCKIMRRALKKSILKRLVLQIHAIVFESIDEIKSVNE